MIEEYKKTATIHALQWDGTLGRTRDIVTWAADFGTEIELDKSYLHSDAGEDVLRIPTLEGPMYASVGDFIAKGVNNEFWAIKPDIMAKTYRSITSTQVMSVLGIAFTLLFAFIGLFVHPAFLVTAGFIALCDIYLERRS